MDPHFYTRTSAVRTQTREGGRQGGAPAWEGRQWRTPRAVRRPPFALVRRASLTSAICHSKEVTTVMPASTSSVPKFNNWPSPDACDDVEENRGRHAAMKSFLAKVQHSFRSRSPPPSLLLPSPPSHRPDSNNMFLQARDPKPQTPNRKHPNPQT